MITFIPIDKKNYKEMLVEYPIQESGDYYESIALYAKRGGNYMRVEIIERFKDPEETLEENEALEKRQEAREKLEERLQELFKANTHVFIQVQE